MQNVHLLFQERPNENPATSSLETFIDALLQVTLVWWRMFPSISANTEPFQPNPGYDNGGGRLQAKGGTKVLDLLQCRTKQFL